MTMLVDCDPDPTEETTYGYCAHCEKDVPVVRRDFGIGRDNAWGRSIIHVDMQWCCCECGDPL
jgi:hypothetical protein